MALSAAELSTLSRLLDEAMDLPGTAVEPWLAGLVGEHAGLVGPLRRLLSERSASTGFLSAGPALTGDDDSVAREGDRVGPYRLIRELGRGGMGAVWLADRAEGGVRRKVALKLPRLAWDSGLAERMARERDIGALLEHPDIARLYDAGVDERGRPFLALEHIEGLPLDEWCRTRHLSMAARCSLFLQVARAVAYAHGRLVVHRDLKPSNVLVTPDGQAHLLDFGIAKLLDDASAGARLTEEQGRLFTPDYASPEQIEGRPITVASDVYSLGVLLYEMLSGQRPHGGPGTTRGALEEAILRGDIPLASSKAADRQTARRLRGELDAILAKALRRAPDARYATADALAEDVQRHLSGERVLARPDTLGYRIGKTLKRHRIAFAATGAVAFAVMGAGVVSVVQANRAAESAQRARAVKEFVIDVFRVNDTGAATAGASRQLPAEMLLERGARLIEARFPEDGRIRAELYGVVGGIFSNMGAYRLSADYALRQQSTLETLHAPADEQARSSLLIAGALLSLNRLAAAKARASQVAELADMPRDVHAGSLVMLAQIAAKLGEGAEAARTLAAAQDAVAAIDGHSALRATVLSLQARQLSKSNRFDAAVPLYEAAIAEGRAADGPASITVVELMLQFGAMLESYQRIPEGRKVTDAAIAILRSMGSAGDIRAALEEVAHETQLYVRREVRFESTRAAIERNREVLRSHGGIVPASLTAQVDFNLGLVLVNWGDVMHAYPLVSGAVPLLRQDTESAAQLSHLAAVQGVVSSRVGLHDEAAAAFAEMVRLRTSRTPNEPFNAVDYQLVTTNMLMQGRYAEAERVMASLPHFAARPGDAHAEDYARVVRLQLARIALTSGDAPRALTLFPPEAKEPGAFPELPATLHGEILCAVGRHDEGLALLAESIVPDPEAYRFNPYDARARAVAGLCELGRHRRQAARRLAALADEAFTAQPGVSPYYKAPLERLRTALGNEPTPPREPTR